MSFPRGTELGFGFKPKQKPAKFIDFDDSEKTIRRLCFLFLGSSKLKITKTWRGKTCWFAYLAWWLVFFSFYPVQSMSGVVSKVQFNLTMVKISP